MVHTELSPADALRAALMHLDKKAPALFRAPLAPLLHALDNYVVSIERRQLAVDARLQGLDKMPSAAALDVLVTPLASNRTDYPA